MKAFITVVGSNADGIITGITSILNETNVSILDIGQIRLEKNYFTMIMATDVTDMKIGFGELKDTLIDTGNELGVTVKIQHEDIFNSMHKI